MEASTVARNGPWRHRVFRNSFTRDGELHRVRAWSVKIQFNGVRKTLSLRARDRRQASAEAEEIQQALAAGGWEAVERLRARSSTSESAGATADVDLVPKSEARYWQPRLLRRRYLGGKHELSVRVEHDGIGYYFPLGTANEEIAAARAVEIHGAVVKSGWEEVARRFPRDLTVAFHWAADPLAWTYTTIQSHPFGAPSNGDEFKQTSPGARNFHIALVEADSGIERALTHHLQRYSGMVLQFSDGMRALQAVPRQRVDFALINHALPDMSGEDCARRLLAFSPQLPCLVYSAYEDSEQLFKSTPGGVSGYLLKRTAPDHLLAPIDELVSAGAVTTAQISERVRQYFGSLTFRLESGQHDHVLSRLTRREKEILECLSKGYLDKEIADVLGISAWTVHGHIKNLFEKLGVHSRIEAVLKYLHK